MRITHKSSAKKRILIQPIIKNDSLRLGVEIRNKEKFEKFLESLDCNDSTTVKNTKIADDILAVDSLTIDPDTIARYCQILSDMYLINNQEPFSLSVHFIAQNETGPKTTFCRSFPSRKRLACLCKNVGRQSSFCIVCDYRYCIQKGR